ncbi:MAG: GNAT family N-acetyltransferase [Rubrobacter sp.]
MDPEVPIEDLNRLFAEAWGRQHPRWRIRRLLHHSLAYVCAFQGSRLVGFVNVAGDGGIHAFLLDVTVHPGFRGRGVGRTLVRRAVEAAEDRGSHWVHVDFEPGLRGFYRRCGFRPSEAGLMRLSPEGAVPN